MEHIDTSRGQTFHLKNKTVEFDSGKSILLCRDSFKNKNLWAKKIVDVSSIDDIMEDETHLFVNCMKDEKSGQYLALDKENGSTVWYIPGRSFLNVIFEAFVYLIFIDNHEKYFLIKVDKNTGTKIWFHEIRDDLKEYSFRSSQIVLKYESGATERLSPHTGLRHA